MNVDNVVFKIAGEEGIKDTEQVQEVIRRLDDLLAYNPGYAPLLDMHPIYRKHVIDMLNASSDFEKNLYQRQLAAEMNLEARQFGIEHPVLAKFLPKSPKRQKTLITAPALSVYGAEVPDSYIVQVRKALDNPNVRTAVTKFEELEDNVHALAAREGIVFDDFTTMGDLMPLLNNKKLSPDELNQVRRYLDMAGVLGKGASVRQLWAKSVADAYFTEMANELKVNVFKTPNNPIARYLLNLRQAWMDLALTSVRYHTANALDMSVKSLVEGYGPVIGKSAWDLARRWEVIPPQYVVNNRNTAAIGGQFLTSAEFGAGNRSAAISEVIPGAPGRAIGKVTNLNKDIAHTMESAFRTYAWAGELRRRLREVKPILEREVIKQLGPTNGATVNSMLKAMDVDFGPTKLREIVMAQGGTPEQAASLGAMWQRSINAASVEGAKASNLVHFNYLDERNIEVALKVRYWAPFYYWGSRNLPYFIQTMAQHPWIARLWAAYSEMSEEELKNEGLPRRFQGKTHMAFLDGLFGPFKVYANPMVAFSIADQLRPQSEDYDATPLGKLIGRTRRIGLSLAPWVDIPLGMSGIYGPDQEPPNVVRQTGLINKAVSAATGVPFDIEAPFKSVVRKLSGSPEPTSKQTIFGIPSGGDSYLDYQVAKRLAEMSLERTGRANSLEYLQAAGNPNHPLYKEALRDVQARLLMQEIYGFTSPFPMTLLPDTEAYVRQRNADIRKAMEGIPAPGQRAIWRELVRSGDPATAYWEATSDPRALQLNRAIAEYNSIIPDALGIVQRRRVLQSNPLLETYFDWLKTLPEGADRSVEAFIASSRR
jgi:hypothetical protein